MLKIMKNSFAAIIAILAISASIASYAGAFKGTAADPIAAPGCYIEVNAVPTSFPSTNPAPETDWDEIQLYSLPVADRVVVTSGTELNPANDCPPLFETFCCFEVDFVDGAYKIVGVRYKEV